MSGNRPCVTVGMPVFNGGPWIHSAARAILEQSYANVRLIISDNCSTDETPEVCMQLAQQDERVQYVRQSSNVGANENYNRVFRLAESKYFKWASCNDLCAPTLIARAVDVLEKRADVVLAHSRSWLFRDNPDDAEPYDDDLHLMSDIPYERYRQFFANIRLNNVMNGVVRHDALRRTSLMRPFFSSDTNLMAELALHGKFYEIPERLFYRRMSARSSTKLKSDTERLRHWSPQLHPVRFSQLRGLSQQFGGLARAPIKLGQKIRLASFVTRRAISARHVYLREVADLSHGK